MHRWARGVVGEGLDLLEAAGHQGVGERAGLIGPDAVEAAARAGAARRTAAARKAVAARVGVRTKGLEDRIIGLLSRMVGVAREVFGGDCRAACEGGRAGGGARVAPVGGAGASAGRPAGRPVIGVDREG
jgi:hypothetical protein